LLHLGTLVATMRWRAIGWRVLMAPTILAWDWTAIRRILLLEASSSPPPVMPSWVQQASRRAQGALFQSRVPLSSDTSPWRAA